MNKALLIGRITRDLELRNTTNGTPVCSFSIAINRIPGPNGEEITDFINIVVFNKQAENLVKYCTKGSLIAVDGSIQTRNYDDKDGKKVYVTEVLANRIQFLDTKKSAMENNTLNSNVSPYDFNQETPSMNVTNTKAYEDFGSSVKIDEDELPF